ncbi:lasso peptide biosynthesis B2 protein [Micromonospora sp. WMMD1102]|uniref:lasso peptide biosynthesis B2 protein n=1 Tax=Micromonospora sp. WMMD1102 TaxID=3016105 RepID=UPI0024153EFE|nr:lasso peptide biosynthesis B2 protein [Micromonospora sp. WMMD1102]MDG4788009.1 lasso peptide biosynthesis B2 protein [Micromonospora sp. WMMD1102]
MLRHDPRRLGVRRRLTVRAAVVVARLLAVQKPDRIRLVLRRLSRGARPASRAEAAAARRDTVTTSAFCSGPVGCLPRSIATVLLCRLAGSWPVWHAGVRRYPPFGAHAWVSVDGIPVDEPYPEDFHIPLLTVAVDDRPEPG